MSRPSVHFSALRDAAAWEHGLRFVFGGIVTVGAGLVAETWGPLVGGLFLAFPSILPASLTLVKEHDGRAQAAADARGARIGAVALVAFALVVNVLVTSAGGWALAAAGLSWLAAASIGWFLVDRALMPSAAPPPH